jgi:hypothetical protein
MTVAISHTLCKFTIIMSIDLQDVSPTASLADHPHRALP